MSRLTAWAEAHRAAALDVVRVYLGVGLLVRGVTFLVEPGAYLDLLPDGGAFTSLAVLHYVGLAHLGGGLLLAAGLLTRLAALVQIPVLFGAAFLVHLPAVGLTGQSFAFAALVLALLAVFAVWGGGPWSLDRVVAGWNARDEEAEREGGLRVVRQLRERERARVPAPLREPAVSGDGGPAVTCTCGHDREHAAVVTKRHYDGLNGLRFMTGTHPRPSSVVYHCRDCGGVVSVETDPEALEAFRFERTAS
jgi:uncharacterized membrane protein YphA (DoxX/SURF4 family)